MINGLSIREHMDTIRQSLGVCPQFDILWPDITVREHLELYAAIKGFKRSEAASEAETAARDVGEQLYFSTSYWHIRNDMQYGHALYHVACLQHWMTKWTPWLENSLAAKGAS